MTSQHNTGTHPFYIGMYIHICTHIYVHIYTSQKECLCIFYVAASDMIFIDILRATSELFFNMDALNCTKAT